MAYTVDCCVATPNSLLNAALPLPKHHHPHQPEYYLNAGKI